MEQKRPRNLTENECETLLKCLLCHGLSAMKQMRGFRNHLAALLMLDAGLRVGEVAGLVIGDLITYEEPVIRLFVRKEIAKGKRERTVPCTDRLKSSIRTVMHKYWLRPDLHMDWPAIPGENHQAKITTVQLERIIKSAAAACIYRQCTPHMLRHTFATRLMRTTNIRVVQELLGHKNLASTQIYTHPDQGDLDKAIGGL